MPDILSEDLREALDEACDQGSEAMDEGEFQEAAAFFLQGLDLLPKPAEEWDAYGWLQAALGDAYYHMEDYTAALNCFRKASEFAGPEEVGPFVLLRLGQCLRRLGNAKDAAEFLTRAYQLDGENIFEGEEDDLAFLKQTAFPA